MQGKMLTKFWSLGPRQVEEGMRERGRVGGSRGGRGRGKGRGRGRHVASGGAERVEPLGSHSSSLETQDPVLEKSFRVQIEWL